MITRSQLILSKIKDLFEELFFPTVMNLREMSDSERNLYSAMVFPDSSNPCIGSFLDISWVAILDYTGLMIRSIEDSSKSYIIPFRARSCEELATTFCNTLDTLVTLTSEDQLYDDDFLKKHQFIANTNKYG